jgi:hypothetical protein
MAKKGTIETEKAPKDVAESKLSFKKADWPLNAKVEYTGERVSEHKGMSGVIVGYRPTNGLWVKFPNGKGSISIKQAKLVGGKPASKAASKRAGKATPGTSEPETEATEQSA